MDLTPHVLAIQADLAAAAALGGDEAAEAGSRLSEAVEPSLRLRLLDVLTEASAALGQQLGSSHVEVRLVGRAPELVLVDERPPEAEALAFPNEANARITLRVPEGLKTQVEDRAARERVSINTWVVRTLARALEPRH